MSALAISWDDLTAGVWTPHYTQRPCAEGLRAVGRRWPEWSCGTPPTWAEFVAAPTIAAADRRWLVAHVLLRDRRRLVAWAVDCAEAVGGRVDKHETQAQICAEVIAPLRTWISGGSISLHAVRGRAWRIQSVDVGAAAIAAAYAADAAAYAANCASTDAASYAYAATYAAAAAAGTVTGDDDDDDRMLMLALPHLADARGARREDRP